MCGITGSIAFQESGKTRLDKVQAATEQLKKRGPDGNGIYRTDSVSFGHARLSIIDVSNNGSQPFTDNSGRFTIVFNGEFFNFQSYRNELEQSGIQFRSTSDTEVLLNLFIREGISCLSKINGFFAFAVHDKETGDVFMARDRYGVKPFLYFLDSSGISFASEMKALMQFGIPKVIDRSALYQYLHLNYIPAPETIFEGVKKLEPGHYLKISGGKVKKVCWYEMPTTIKQPVPDYASAQSILVDKMTASVERRMISDVPLGSFLSGGIDSSVVTAIASSFTSNLNTFSIGYQDEPLFDETKYARLVADRYKTNHTVFSLRNKDLFDHLHEMLEYIDEPFADSSALAVNILCRETRKKVTVALSGDGADELFGGYMKHYGEWKLRNGGFKAQVVNMLGPAWDALPKSRNSKFGNTVRKLQKFSRGMKAGSTERYWQWCGYADADYLKSMAVFPLNSAEIEARKKYHTRFIGTTGDMNDMLLNDMHLVLPGDMLTKVDLMSMANSLEVRTPFLDFELVDFAASLPPDYKVNGKGRKLIVQDAFRSILPEELYHRPKHGFEVPLLKWFREDLNSWIFDDLLSHEEIISQGLFSTEGIKKLKDQLMSNDPGDSTARIWALIVFQSWYRRWMK